MGIASWWGGDRDDDLNPPTPGCDYWAGRTLGDKLCGKNDYKCPGEQNKKDDPANEDCPQCTKKKAKPVYEGNICCMCYTCEKK